MEAMLDPDPVEAIEEVVQFDLDEVLLRAVELPSTSASCPAWNVWWQSRIVNKETIKRSCFTASRAAIA